MIIELSKRDFDEYAFKHPYRTFYQTSQYGMLMSKHGFKPIFVGYDEGGLKAAAMILVKEQLNFKVGYCPRGYLVDFNNYKLVEDFTFALKSYLSKKGIISITIDPHITHLKRDQNGKPIEESSNGVTISEALKRIGYVHNGFNLYFENLKPRWNMVLKTDKTPIEIFNGFQKQTRTKIRNSLRKGVEIYKGNRDDLTLFYQMINKKQNRKYDYYLDMHTLFTPFNMFDVYFARINTEVFLRNSNLLYEHEMKKNNKLAEALQKPIKDPREKGKLLNKKIESDKLLNSYKNDVIFGTKLHRDSKYIVIASNAIVKYGNEIFFLIDGINFKFKNFNANHLLKWKIIEEYSKKGFTKFHFNGITGDFTKKNKYTGLLTFKKGFNAVVTEYIGEYTFVFNHLKYGMYKIVKPILDIGGDSMKKD